jgi:hypothetical protein
MEWGSIRDEIPRTINGKASSCSQVVGLRSSAVRYRHSMMRLSDRTEVLMKVS